MTRRIFFLTVLTLACSASAAFANDTWNNWRGPNQNGSVSSGPYAKSWSETKNIKWDLKLPGASSSTPNVYKNKIIMTVPIDGENGVIALDLNGRELWRQTLGAERPGKHKKASGSNSSPVTDDDRIYVYFKSGDLAALDWDGKIIWHKNFQKEYGEDTLWWDLGTSPVRTSKHLVVACIQTGPSFLVAFDPATGKEAWKVDRILEAPDESNQSYTTPLVVHHEGQEQLVILGADHVTCHDATNGKEIWRVGGLNPEQIRFFRSISSPIQVGDVILAPYARGKSTTAIKLGGKGDVTNSHVLWTKELGADVPTPAFYKDNLAIVVSDRGQITCINAQTGDEIWTAALEKNRNAYSSSPVISGDTLYYVREDGVGFVFDLAKQETISTNEMTKDDATFATPVLVGNQILLKTSAKLYSISEETHKVSLAQ